MTLERAKKHLDAWYEAELAVSTGQSYSISGRQLTRASLPEIRKQIQFWEKRIASMSGRSRRVKRVIPRDF
mgnify:CR=1 FL=1